MEANAKFVSLWGGKPPTPEALASELEDLYNSIGLQESDIDPEVCAEKELVPINELLEPFGFSELIVKDAVTSAQRVSVRLATTVVAVYWNRPMSQAGLRTNVRSFRLLGTFAIC